MSGIYLSQSAQSSRSKDSFVPRATKIKPWMPIFGVRALDSILKFGLGKACT